MRGNALLVTAAAATVFFLGAVIFFDHAGRSARTYGKAADIAGPGVEAVLLNTSGDVYRLWERLGLKGRVVVNLGRGLHFLDPLRGEPVCERSTSDYRAKKRQFDEAVRSRVGRESFLFVAMDRGIAREIYNVLPEQEFDGVAVERGGAGGGVVLGYAGSKRVLTKSLPRPDEPVVLNIDASFFGSADVRDFVGSLKRSGIRVDVLTLCLAEDDPGVSGAERERLMEFKRALRGL